MSKSVHCRPRVLHNIARDALAVAAAFAVVALCLCPSAAGPTEGAPPYFLDRAPAASGATSSFTETGVPPAVDEPSDDTRPAPADAGDAALDAFAAALAAFVRALGRLRSAGLLTGLVSGLVAFANLVVNLSKLGFVDRWITQRGWKWTRPLLSIAAGVGGSQAAAASLGVSPLVAAVLGAVGGLGGIGVHEVVALRSPQGRARRALLNGTVAGPGFRAA